MSLKLFRRAKRKQKPISPRKKLTLLLLIIGLITLGIDAVSLYLQQQHAQNIVDIVGLRTAYAYCTGDDNPFQAGYDGAAQNGVVDGVNGINLTVAYNETTGDTVVVMYYSTQAILLDHLFTSRTATAVVYCRPYSESNPPIFHPLE